MKIDRPNSYSAVSTAAIRGASSKPVSAVGETRPANDDSTVRQSDAAKIASQGAPKDGAKIERIRAEIAAGHYVLDIQALAQKMIDMDVLGGE